MMKLEDRTSKNSLKNKILTIFKLSSMKYLVGKYATDASLTQSVLTCWSYILTVYCRALKILLETQDDRLVVLYHQGLQMLQEVGISNLYHKTARQNIIYLGWMVYNNVPLFS